MPWCYKNNFEKLEASNNAFSTHFFGWFHQQSCDGKSRILQKLCVSKRPKATGTNAIMCFQHAVVLALGPVPEPHGQQSQNFPCPPDSKYLCMHIIFRFTCLPRKISYNLRDSCLHMFIYQHVYQHPECTSSIYPSSFCFLCFLLLWHTFPESTHSTQVVHRAAKACHPRHQTWSTGHLQTSQAWESQIKNVTSQTSETNV